MPVRSGVPVVQDTKAAQSKRRNEYVDGTPALNAPRCGSCRSRLPREPRALARNDCGPCALIRTQSTANSLRWPFPLDIELARQSNAPGCSEMCAKLSYGIPCLAGKRHALRKQALRTNSNCVHVQVSACSRRIVCRASCFDRLVWSGTMPALGDHRSGSFPSTSGKSIFAACMRDNLCAARLGPAPVAPDRSCRGVRLAVHYPLSHRSLTPRNFRIAPLVQSFRSSAIHAPVMLLSTRAVHGQEQLASTLDACKT